MKTNIVTKLTLGVLLLLIGTPQRVKADYYVIGTPPYPTEHTMWMVGPYGGTWDCDQFYPSENIWWGQSWSYASDWMQSKVNEGYTQWSC